MLGEAIGEVLAFGVGVALSPLATVAIVVMLLAPPAGDRQAWAFLGSWMTSLALGSTVVLLLSDAADASAGGEPATWVSVAKILLAAALLAFAAGQWRGRPGGGERRDPPAWMEKLDGITVRGAAALAGAFVLVKPKNLLLTIGAAIAVAQVGAPAGTQAAALAVFVLLGSAGLVAPLAIAVLSPERGRDRLSRLRDWMVRENEAIIAVLCVLLAAKLLGDGLASLAG